MNINNFFLYKHQSLNNQILNYAKCVAIVKLGGFVWKTTALSVLPVWNNHIFFKNALFIDI